MKTKKLIWAKTILFAYKYLGSLCRSIDKTVKNIAVHSFYIGGYWSEGNSTQNISQKILELSNKKIDYINLKVMIEKTLQSMKKDNAKILILRNIKELSIQTIANLLNMSERTYYRKANCALNEFANIMEKVGCSVEKLEIGFWDDQFIKSIYKITDSENFSVLNSIEAERELIDEYIFSLCGC